MTTMTDEAQPSLDDATAARIERLRQRRAASAASPTASAPAHGPDRVGVKARQGVATGTRIAALGIGGTAMFGIMAALAMADNDAAATPPPTSPARQPIVVVIHTSDSAPDGALTTGGLTTGSGLASAPTPVESLVTTAPAPVELRAQPVITTVEVQQAAPAAAQAPVPAAKTNGSR